MTARFDGKVALVTGGAGAIGSAAASRFAADGARVVIVDRDDKAAERALKALRAAGAEVTSVVADVGSEAGAGQAVAAALSAYGRLDVLFNNAGIAGVRAPVHELAVEAFDEIVRTNLRSMFLVLRQSARAMIAADIAGAIVNMGSSMAGWDVLDGGAGYATTKHGVVGLTRVAALDLARYGIRVNAVCPGVIETTLGVPVAKEADTASAVGRFADRIPLRRIGQPEDVAAVVAFLASSDAAHVTGASWLIDGGQTLQSWSNAPDGTTFPLVHGAK